MSNAILSTGTLIAMGNGGSPETFTTIAEIKSITGPEISRNVIDVTTHNTTGGWEEALAGLLRSGEVSFDINFVPTDATHDPTTGLLAAIKNNTKTNFQITFPDGSPATVWSFSGYVTKFGTGAEIDNVLNASITIKPTGAITLS